MIWFQYAKYFYEKFVFFCVAFCTYWSSGWLPRNAWVSRIQRVRSLCFGPIASLFFDAFSSDLIFNILLASFDASPFPSTFNQELKCEYLYLSLRAYIKLMIKGHTNQPNNQPAKEKQNQIRIVYADIFIWRCN